VCEIYPTSLVPFDSRATRPHTSPLRLIVAESKHLLDMASSARSARSPDHAPQTNSGRQLREDSDDGDDTSGFTVAGPSAPARLACRPCRARRVKCDHARPICAVSAPRAVSIRRIHSHVFQACTRSDIPCEWPTGRQRKRTRREMEEARSGEVEGVRGPLNRQELGVATPVCTLKLPC
jgi:hypothetical protein